MKKVLVIGSWAKEQITIENIKKNPSYQVFSYLDTKNPAIISLADGFFLGNLSDLKAVLAYAKKIKPDLILITTAFPLAAGLADELKLSGYKVFGPQKKSAQLEADKAFTRSLMRKHIPESLPEFKIFSEKKQAIDYATQKNFQVAVKPIGLTEGLGVKVFGDQLKNKQEVIAYFEQILEKNSKVIIEEKIAGQEFTLQCFVKGTLILPTWCVQDFKKLLEGDKGPNTASMGSYSAAGKLLPFMNQADYNQALKIIEKTIAAFLKETGQEPCGFLYGQFMLTESGVKLIEYNFRPGDPEWINTVFVLKDNIAEIIEKILLGRPNQLNFQHKATVCKYITPQEYPYKLNQILDVDFPQEAIKSQRVGVYYSCGLGKKGKLEVGSERGIAFVAAAETIEAASLKVEKAIEKVKGNFFHRKDIGTRRQIKEKINQVKKVRQK